MRRYADRAQATTYAREVEVIVEPQKARFSTWYELFPRSTGPADAGRAQGARPQRHGTFKDVERLVPEIARMGFDVLYLPPIHPIGRTHRKGANNKPAQPGEPGSPWAIGSEAGGHKAVNPELGTLADFRRLVKTAAGQKEDGLRVKDGGFTDQKHVASLIHRHDHHAVTGVEVARRPELVLDDFAAPHNRSQVLAIRGQQRNIF